MLQHPTQVLYLADVADSGLLELEVLLVQQVLIDLRLRVVVLRALLWVCLIREIVLLHVLHDVEPLLDLLEEALGRGDLPLSSLLVVVSNIEELAAANLVETVSLIGILREDPFHKLLELLRVRYALEDLPKVLLLRRGKALEVRIGLHGLAEWRRLHLDHEQ